jgi:hypothetical protein
LIMQRRGTAILLVCYALGEQDSRPRRTTMIRTIFAMAVAGLIFAAVSGTSQAAPIAPLPAGVTSAQGNVTQVYWHHWHHHCHWHRCW